MLNVICARWGTGFEGYAERLQSMVARHLTLPHVFHCYEEEELRRYAPPRFWQYDSPGRPGLHRGYPLLFCFHPNLPLFTNHPYLDSPGGRVLFLGLDIVITGNLNELVAREGEFWAIRDWGQGNFNNSVMLFDARKRSDVFEDFPPADAAGQTEQDWLSRKFPAGQTWPDEWVRSYKFHNCSKGVPEGCKVVVFHGQPKNHQVKDAWVTEAWQ